MPPCSIQDAGNLASEISAAVQRLTWAPQPAAEAPDATATGVPVAVAGMLSPLVLEGLVEGAGAEAGGFVTPDTAMAGLPLVLVDATPLPHVEVLPSGLVTGVCPGGQLVKACCRRRVSSCPPRPNISATLTS